MPPHWSARLKKIHFSTFSKAPNITCIISPAPKRQKICVGLPVNSRGKSQFTTVRRTLVYDWRNRIFFVDNSISSNNVFGFVFWGGFLIRSNLVTKPAMSPAASTKDLNPLKSFNCRLPRCVWSSQKSLSLCVIQSEFCSALD